VDFERGCGTALALDCTFKGLSATGVMGALDVNVASVRVQFEVFTQDTILFFIPVPELIVLARDELGEIFVKRAVPLTSALRRRKRGEPLPIDIDKAVRGRVVEPYLRLGGHLFL